MIINRIKVLAVVLVLGIVLTACSFGPPPSCGDNIGGTADTTKFDQYFNGMSLVYENSGQPGQDGDNGMQFTQGEPLVIQVDSKSEVNLRACIQPMSGAKEVTLDETQSFSQGQGSFSIGTLKAGTYVIRVIVDDTLVKNFPFVLK
jgi:hypothetical protein